MTYLIFSFKFTYTAVYPLVVNFLATSSGPCYTHTFNTTRFSNKIIELFQTGSKPWIFTFRTKQFIDFGPLNCNQTELDLLLKSIVIAEH